MNNLLECAKSRPNLLHMSVLYLIIPFSILLVITIVWLFLWAVRSGQFDDMEGPAHRILMDDDLTQSGKSTGSEKDGNQV